jgi:hypothetical protein
LINAVHDLFPDLEHKFYVRHMWANFHMLFKGDALKNQIWICARSSTPVWFEANMQQMKNLNLDAHA